MSNATSSDLALYGGAPTRESMLVFGAPLIGQEEIDEVVATLRSGWIGFGPKCQRFEREFADYTHCTHAVSMSSCTAALQVALAVCGIGRGDDVLTTPLTFAATANVIELAGARPVFADVEPDTGNIDPLLAAQAMTDNVRALIPVHLYGRPCDMAAVHRIADASGATVVEDAAHAIESRHVAAPGSMRSRFSAFSFYATKNLTTAEGGMLTGDPTFLDRARLVALHGMSRDGWKRYDKGGSWFYEVLLPGFKYNMTDIQAALGLWQLKKLAAFQARRRELAELYNSVFACEDSLEVPVTRADVEHAWHIYVLRLRPETLRIGRDEFIEELKRRNIGTSVHFIPIHLHPYYRDKYSYAPERFPVAYENYGRMVSLPLNPRLTDADAGDVIQAVLDVVRTFSR
jgi:dTDP-4-amino-4,6-dideoxygalactose transaminase